jgi:hypothetical protein
MLSMPTQGQDNEEEQCVSVCVCVPAGSEQESESAESTECTHLHLWVFCSWVPSSSSYPREPSCALQIKQKSGNLCNRKFITDELRKYKDFVLLFHTSACRTCQPRKQCSEPSGRRWRSLRRTSQGREATVAPS